jgi:hypothetical protein
MAGIGDFPTSKDSSTPIVTISNHTFTFAKFPFLTDEGTIPSIFVSRIMFGCGRMKSSDLYQATCGEATSSLCVSA